MDPQGGRELLHRQSYPSERGLARRMKRFERALSTFEVTLAEKNQQLRAEAQDPLKIEELVGGAHLPVLPSAARPMAILRPMAISRTAHGHFGAIRRQALSASGGCAIGPLCRPPMTASLVSRLPSTFVHGPYVSPSVVIRAAPIASRRLLPPRHPRSRRPRSVARQL